MIFICFWDDGSGGGGGGGGEDGVLAFRAISRYDGKLIECLRN